MDLFAFYFVAEIVVTCVTVAFTYVVKGKFLRPYEYMYAHVVHHFPKCLYSYIYIYGDGVLMLCIVFFSYPRVSAMSLALCLHISLHLFVYSVSPLSHLCVCVSLLFSAGAAAPPLPPTHLHDGCSSFHVFVVLPPLALRFVRSSSSALSCAPSAHFFMHARVRGWHDAAAMQYSNSFSSKENTRAKPAQQKVLIKRERERRHWMWGLEMDPLRLGEAGQRCAFALNKNEK